MSLTFETLIQHNKSVSRWLVVAICLVLALIGGIVSLGLFGPLIRGGDLPSRLISSIFIHGAMAGVALALIGSIVSYYCGSFIVSLVNNSKPIEHCEDPELFNVVEEMAIAAGLPMPRIHIIFDESPNAFATGRDPKHAIIGITTGLRRKLSRDELQAVIAHEMAHIKNYDIRLMMLVGVYAGIIVLISDFFCRSFLHGFRLRGRTTRSGPSASDYSVHPVIGLLMVLVALLFAWMAPFLAKILQLAISREREYLADATAIKFCRNPLALASALKKIATDPDELELDNRATEHMFIINPDPKRRLQRADRDSVWSTHPPLIKRIQRLHQLA